MLNYVNSGKKKIGWLPYPSSLRMLSWTRFLSRFPKAPIEIFVALAEDAAWLYRFPEYQLDGNHLWENGLALLVAGQFLENRKFKERGEQILRSCIAEQILADGGHAEGSPMYQSLLLWRLLQGIELMGHLAESEPELLTFLKENAGRMLSWLRQMSFSNGTWPMTNDSAFGIAPDTKTVVEYANKLGVLSAELPLSASGYRMIKNGRMEIFVDVAPIQPSYQPGHSHADTGNFCLYLDGNPIVIDLGVSTYEVGNRRAYERSTAAHNVSRIGNDNSSDVWKSFRVGKRAKILAVSELGNNITLLYKDCCGNRFERSFSWMQNRLIIKDNLVNLKAKIFSGQLHFHPSIELEKLSDSSVKGGDCFFEFIGCERVEIFEYYYPETFNKTIISHGVKYKSANAELLVELNFG
ncbi:MAG: alginate lyase family protein [Chitinophagaceae bacterium]